MLYFPVNGVTWTLGSIPTIKFGVKALRNYKKDKNPVARIYGYITVTIGLSFICFGLPLLLTQNLHIIKYTSWLADVLIESCMQFLVWLLWFLKLRNYIRLRHLLPITISYSIVMLTYEFFTSTATIDKVHNLDTYTNKPLVLIMQSIFYIGLSWPIGYYFLTQIPRQINFRSKAKDFINAMIFISVSGAVTENNLFAKGGDTVASDLILCGFFILFFIISFVPPDKLASRVIDKPK